MRGKDCEASMTNAVSSNMILVKEFPQRQRHLISANTKKMTIRYNFAAKYSFTSQLFCLSIYHFSQNTNSKDACSCIMHICFWLALIFVLTKQCTDV